jgi:osmotically-inducible protein OsmY
VYKKLNDYRLYVDVTNALFFDKKLKGEGKSLDIAVLNGDVLIVGHLPTHELLIEEKQRLTKVNKYRRLFNQISISDSPANTIQDGWITTKIRSGIFADDSIDPNAFKVVTSDRIVYLMGDVKKDEADKVIAIARKTEGVLRVVTLMKYFTYQSK